MSDQAFKMAHLRPLGTCATCGRPATQALYNGLNSIQGYYCGSHAKGALARLKRGVRP